jgi:hypothetical protein
VDLREALDLSRGYARYLHTTSKKAPAGETGALGHMDLEGTVSWLSAAPGPGGI